MLPQQTMLGCQKIFFKLFDSENMRKIGRGKVQKMKKNEKKCVIKRFLKNTKNHLNSRYKQI